MNNRDAYVRTTCFIRFRMAGKPNEGIFSRLTEDIDERTEFYATSKTAEAAKENFKADHFIHVFFELPKSFFKEKSHDNFLCLSPFSIQRENIEKIIYYQPGNTPVTVTNKDFISILIKQQLSLEKRYLAEQKAADKSKSTVVKKDSKEEWIELKTLYKR